MARRKSANPEKLYTCSVRTRVTAVVFQRLEKMIGKSDCYSIGEVARKILSNQEIKVFYVDASLDQTMEQLALIRKELKAIGININQITKRYNSTWEEKGKAFYAIKVTELFNPVEQRVDELLKIVSQLAVVWLQKS
ncbi:plasmid mobilization relaxosome protein MobC [Mucilaginibacter sp.]|uniref:plasmid mobilization protein n=1 Tax=Mucilaginibacter sp. TaxID=1882438 RepID=UPI00260F6111|nr:plasmid mobilization relaxosome protein MobC [Mucilaginibacter sp.]